MVLKSPWKPCTLDACQMGETGHCPGCQPFGGELSGKDHERLHRLADEKIADLEAAVAQAQSAVDQADARLARQRESFDKAAADYKKAADKILVDQEQHKRTIQNLFVEVADGRRALAESQQEVAALRQQLLASAAPAAPQPTTSKSAEPEPKKEATRFSLLEVE